MERLEKTELPIRAKSLSGIPFAVMIASSLTLQAFSDTERQGEVTSYTKIKEIQIFRNGTLTATYDDKKENATYNVDTAFYVNSAISGSGYAAGTSYTTRTKLLTVKAGDFIQVYARTANSGTDYFIRNFRLYFDLAKKSFDHEFTLE
jgi:hypothetical protein